MNAQPPRIAIPEPTSTDEAYNQRSLPQYMRAVEAAGGIPVPILLQESSETQTRLLATCCAILLPGSPADVDPVRYGQPMAKECAAKDALREAVDDLLFEDAFSTGKPILGICYGLQSLNVWRHGSLIQDLPHAEQGKGNHVNHQPGREVQEAHALVLAGNSRLSRVLGRLEHAKTDLQVNSSHHQAIDKASQWLLPVPSTGSSRRSRVRTLTSSSLPSNGTRSEVTRAVQLLAPCLRHFWMPRVPGHLPRNLDSGTD